MAAQLYLLKAGLRPLRSSRLRTGPPFFEMTVDVTIEKRD